MKDNTQNNLFKEAKERYKKATHNLKRDHCDYDAVWYEIEMWEFLHNKQIGKYYKNIQNKKNKHIKKEVNTDKNNVGKVWENHEQTTGKGREK